jgi:hypothetical protein
LSSDDDDEDEEEESPGSLQDFIEEDSMSTEDKTFTIEEDEQ